MDKNIVSTHFTDSMEMDDIPDEPIPLLPINKVLYMESIISFDDDTVDN